MIHLGRSATPRKKKRNLDFKSHSRICAAFPAVENNTLPPEKPLFAKFAFTFVTTVSNAGERALMETVFLGPASENKLSAL